MTWKLRKSKKIKNGRRSDAGKMKKKIKLFLWIQTPYQDKPEEDYLEIFGGGNSITSEPIYSKKELLENIKYYEKEGYDLSEVKRRMREKDMQERLKSKK